MGKRFFSFDDGATYLVVAKDRDDALRCLLSSGIEFPADGCEYSEKELTAERAASLFVNASEDGRPSRMPLTDAELGDWFCSEW